MLTIKSESHLFGETIVEHGFPAEYDSLLGVLGGTAIPLRPSGPFTPKGRPATPKRQTKAIGGDKAFALFPVDQGSLNIHLRDRLRSEGWTTEPVAAKHPAGAPAELALRGDFARGGVFVEVEFGNSASIFRDLFKFQIASRSGAGEVGVLIVATSQTAKFFDSGVATYEQAIGLLPYMKIGIQMPIWIVGLEPSDWLPVKSRYREMHAVATANGLACHSYDDVFGATASLSDIDEEPSDPGLSI